jgi:hypothetical protein
LAGLAGGQLLLPNTADLAVSLLLALQGHVPLPLESGLGEELEPWAEKKGNSDFHKASERSGLGKCLFEHKVPIKFIPTKM